MTPFDNTDLINQLQSGIADRQSGISAPDGMSDTARRAAHKRTAARAVGAGVPVLAAAGVATVLATGSGAGSTASRGLGASTKPVPALSGAPVKGEDAAYIVKRVKAAIAGDSQGSMVITSQEYPGGAISSDGSLVNLGPQQFDERVYEAPGGSSYQRYVGVGGRAGIDSTNVEGPVVNGEQHITSTVINSTNDTYSQTLTESPVPTGAKVPSPGVDLQSSPAEVQQALQAGQVKEQGTTTIDGTPAIALSVTLPSSDGLEYSVYVDAQTYQPLRSVISGTTPSNASTFVNSWLPATPANIALAEDTTIPAGYTKVENANR